MGYKLKKNKEDSIWSETENGVVIADDYAWGDKLTSREIAIREIAIELLDGIAKKRKIYFMKLKGLSFSDDENAMVSASVKVSHGHGSDVEWQSISFSRKEILPKLRDFTINDIVK